MEYTTIILYQADATIPNFSGLPIDLEGYACNNDTDFIEIRRWSIEEETEADAVLSELTCIIDTTEGNAYVNEYWLDRCTVDEDGWVDESEGPRFAEYEYVTPTKIHLFDAERAMKVASEYAEDNDLVITGTPVFDDVKDAWLVTVTDYGVRCIMKIRTGPYWGDDIEIY